ncbi:MAG: hypothetical protein ABIR17_09830 [Pseudolysinimonas sp.]|uniref:hypothetical protein n=1 Tax=Pseudolysinimonas sp. TaxID=2680009 RepID=UPI003267E22E
MKTLAYWRKNYLFGVARPAALISDGTTLTCLDNALATVFSGPLSSVTVKKGLGIFTVSVDGERVAFLTPSGGSTAPEPSAALLEYLRQTSESPSAAGVAVSAAGGVGAVVGGVAGTALDAVAGAADQVFATANYIKGTKALGAFFTSIGAFAPRDV